MKNSQLLTGSHISKGGNATTKCLCDIRAFPLVSNGSIGRVLVSAGPI